MVENFLHKFSSLFFLLLQVLKFYLPFFNFANTYFTQDIIPIYTSKIINDCEAKESQMMS
jgi:hypothetical protein